MVSWTRYYVNQLEEYLYELEKRGRSESPGNDFEQTGNVFELP